MRAKSLQSCPTLRDPMDCSLPGSSIQKIKNVDDIQQKVHFLHPLHRQHPNRVTEHPSRISVCCIHTHTNMNSHGPSLLHATGSVPHAHSCFFRNVSPRPLSRDIQGFLLSCGRTGLRPHELFFIEQVPYSWTLGLFSSDL